MLCSVELVSIRRRTRGAVVDANWPAVLNDEEEENSGLPIPSVLPFYLGQ